MNWKLLYFGKILRKDTQKYINEENWQEFRISLKGQSLESKYRLLSAYLKLKEYSYESKVRVTNYITALSRGGLIKPSDYKEMSLTIKG